MLALIFMASLCSANPSAINNESTGFWLGFLTTFDSNKERRGREGVFEGSDNSSSISSLQINRKDSHLIITGVVNVRGSASKTFLFLGGKELEHDHRVIPVAMPDIDGRLSFRVNGAVIAKVSNTGDIVITDGYSYPHYIYVGAIGQPIYRIDLSKIQSEQAAPSNR